MTSHTLIDRTKGAAEFADACILDEGMTQTATIEALQGKFSIKPSKGLFSKWWIRRQGARSKREMIDRIVTATAERAAAMNLHGDASQEVNAVVKNLSQMAFDLGCNLRLALVGGDDILGDQIKAQMKLVDSLTENLASIMGEANKAKTRELNEAKFFTGLKDLLTDAKKLQEAQAIANSDATNTEKIAALRKTYFRDVDALEQSGKVVIPE